MQHWLERCCCHSDETPHLILSVLKHSLVSCSVFLNLLRGRGGAVKQAGGGVTRRLTVSFSWTWLILIRHIRCRNSLLWANSSDSRTSLVCARERGYGHRSTTGYQGLTIGFLRRTLAFPRDSDCSVLRSSASSGVKQQSTVHTQTHTHTHRRTHTHTHTHTDAHTQTHQCRWSALW